MHAHTHVFNILQSSIVNSALVEQSVSIVGL